MDSIDVYEVVQRLIGPIKPVGETNTDNDRYENLLEAIDLVDKLLFDIRQVSGYADCQEASRSKAGGRAKDFLNDVGEQGSP